MEEYRRKLRLQWENRSKDIKEKKEKGYSSQISRCNSKSDDVWKHHKLHFLKIVGIADS